MQEIKSYTMKIRTIKVIVLLHCLVSISTHAQKIRASRDHKMNSDRICFSVSCYDEDKKSEIETDAIFSWARKGDDNGFKYFVASIPIDKFSEKGEVISYDDVFLCLDQRLNLRFSYPIGTKLVLPFRDGISRFALNEIEGQVGAIDSTGNIVMSPIYDYIITSSAQLNGILVNKNHENEVVFLCSIYMRDKRNYEFSVLFEDVLPMSRSIHNEFECLVDPESFQQMLKSVSYNEDELNYLSGVFNMLNLNFKTALTYFDQVKNTSRFKKLAGNIRQCKKLL